MQNGVTRGSGKGNVARSAVTSALRRATAKAWFAITPESTKVLREQAEAERKARIIPHAVLKAA